MMRYILTRRHFLSGAGVLGCSTAVALARAGQEKPRVVEISVERVAFTRSEFRVPSGQPVEIRLQSDDTDHGFRILGSDLNVTIPNRGKGVATVTFVPPKPGKYIFECSKLCGAGHSFMRGTLIAE